ncbi:hypothetical protein BKA62DRAFT_208922 [Auriculariales sp. MPI-PUGE-AT-0066]|nr:hypothetical protein BKA62DRAFT_208922 [Auriculariales sp. MPI-PUGE-AT-0066]
MEYTATGEQVTDDATRYFRLDRYQDETHRQGAENTASRMSEQTVDRCISSLRSYLRRDQIKVSDTLYDDTGVLRGDYELVREFDVPCGCLTILEALVVANSISDVSPRYTVLIHTCQFWAINLFLTLRTIVTRRELRIPEERTGSQLSHGGRVHGVRFVDMDSGNATAAFIGQISES